MDLTPLALRIRAFALALPGAHEDYPWGERVIKVRGKVFVFLGRDESLPGSFGFSAKLPQSGAAALALPCTEPTGYGLGKSGWVSVRLDREAPPPEETLLAWIEESYRAVAPKRLAAQLGAGGPGAGR